MSLINHSCSLVVQVFLITMLTVITWNQDSKKLHQCSREKSKIVREVITKKVIPIFAQQKVAIPNECPFHPDRDYLWWPQDEKEDLWTCPFCGIDFFCPDRLTLHWDQTHRESNQERYRDDLVCLADYCDIFRCDVLVRKRLQRKHQENFMGYLSFGQEEAPNCEPDKMTQLEKSCLNVVRQCTISLEANVSAQQFALVEQELVSSVCSYLTCDHYNDDLFTDESVSRKVPITLFSVLGVMMASGFCICYYLIWTLVQRGLVFAADKSTDNKCKVENKLKLSFNNADKMVNKSSNNNSFNYKKSGNFFQNIFEFNHEHKEDTFEFNDFNANVADYERKLRSISSIIEEDEEKDDSDKDISYNSYPIISRKYVKRNLDANRSVLSEQSDNRLSHGSLSLSIGNNQSLAIGKDKSQLKKQIQEIYLHDLPMKLHPKYIQPLKHSFSDRYPCYSGPTPEMVSALSTKSRSYSHSQLRNAHNYVRIMAKPRRQDSIDEEWEQKSQNSHSSMSIKSTLSASKLADSNGKVRNVSKSSLSYNATLPTKEGHQTYQFAPSSKSNSNASIVSRSSLGSRMTTNSGQFFSKR